MLTVGVEEGFVRVIAASAVFDGPVEVMVASAEATSGPAV